MEAEMTMICVDTSITDLCRFNDQIRAVEIYCERKLKAHPDNHVQLVRFGQLDLGTCGIFPTRSLSSKLRALKPLEQEYTDLLEGLKLYRCGWFHQEDMKKRIVVFTGGPLLFTKDQLPEALAFLKEGRVVLDVVDFGTRVKDEEDCKAKNLTALVDAMNHNNNENEDSRYFSIEDAGLSSILPHLVAEEEAPIIRSKAKIHFGPWFKHHNSYNTSIIEREEFCRGWC